VNIDRPIGSARFAVKQVFALRRSEPCFSSGCQEMLVPFSRIIRRGLLLRRRYWINVRAVELRCESTWRCSFGRDFGQGFFGQSPKALSSCGQSARRRSLIANGRRPSIRFWAYSSIGQSPRLITGLFLVRTQVGPLFREAESREAESRQAEFLASEGEPMAAPVADDRARMRGARGLSETGAGQTVAKGLRSWSVPQQHGNEEPTYL
jgi:hypothetical protein